MSVKCSTCGAVFETMSKCSRHQAQAKHPVELKPDGTWVGRVVDKAPEPPSADAKAVWS